MFAFLERDRPAAGRVLYPGAIPPPLDTLGALGAPVTWTPKAPAPATYGEPKGKEHVWEIEAVHPKWGTVDLACHRQGNPLPDVLIDHTLALSDAEKSRARLGQATIAVRVHTRPRQVLADRKRLLFWLRALMQGAGVIGVDTASQLLWSPAMLEDELAHDADLDIEALYTIHAVGDASDKSRVPWLHTHGLDALGAFDIDVLEPSPLFVSNCGDPLRATAFAALEGTIAPGTARFELAHPGGAVRLVPVEEFHAHASPEHQQLRTLDAAHGAPRAVLCEPVGGLFGRWRTKPVPSRFLSTMSDDRFVTPFSTAATALMAERARHTLAVFGRLREEFASLDLPAVAKLGYEVEGGNADEREHLWFEVHNVAADTIDATLVNRPFRVPGLTVGERREHDQARLTDWTIMSPEGQMTPRNLSAARRLRETRATWQTRIDEAKPRPT
jgi:hypothetical protein